MAEILTSKEILVALDNIIKGAEKFICIFTYNLFIDQSYLSRLRNASKRGVKITIAFGVDNGNKEVTNTLLEIPNINLHFKRYLHAKFFYNEKELLVGSMNLSEASGKNNFELGVLFQGKEYLEKIKKVKQEAKEIIDDSTVWPNLGQTKQAKKLEEYTGCCIRCKEKLKFDPFNPLCPACLSVWSEWENNYYQESYCHGCGKPRDGISKAFPQCKPCYNKFISEVKPARRSVDSLSVSTVPSETLDKVLKEILSRHLGLVSTNIPIDMSLKTVFYNGNDSVLKSIVADIEQQFQINLKEISSIQDYWDLYVSIAKTLSPDSLLITGLRHR